MKKTLLTLALIIVLALSSSGQSSPESELRTADLAWDAGDYVTALNGYIRLLSATSADQVLEHIALQTGELYRTDEITVDGVSPRLARLVALTGSVDVVDAFYGNLEKVTQQDVLNAAWYYYTQDRRTVVVLKGAAQ